MRRLSLALLAAATLTVTAAVADGCGGGGHHGAHPPHLSAVIPSAGMIGTAAMVLGSGFGATQGSSTVSIGGAPMTVTSWTPGAIGVTVPAAALGGAQSVVVRVGSTSSNALAFDVQLPARIYVDDCAHSSNARVYGFSVGSTGTPTALAGSPWTAPFGSSSFGGDGAQMAVDPVYRKLYVSGSAALGTWSIDASNGELTSDGPALVVGAANYGLTVSPDGLRLYVAASASDEILGFSAGATSLAPLPDSPYLSDSFGGADIPLLVRDGAFLFLNNESAAHTFEGYRVQSNGSLLPLPGSPFASFVTSASSFSLHSDGRNLYFADFTSGSVGGFVIDAVSGAPTPLAGSPWVGVPNASALVPSRDGRYAWATPYGGTRLARWDVDAAGALLPASLTTSGIAASGAISTIADSADGQRLYVLDAGNRTILGFAIGSSGALTPLAGSPFATGIPAGPLPCTMVVTP